MRRSNPPGLFALLVRLALKDDDRGEAIRGDLLEEFRDRTEAQGGARAAAWYRRAAFGVAWRYCWARVRGDLPQPASSATSYGRVRAAESGDSFHGWLADLGFSLRMIAKRPVASLAIVVTLALGIGVNVMFFSGFSGMILQDLPFDDAQRLVSFSGSRPLLGESWRAVAAGNLADWQRESRSFTRIAPYSVAGLNLSSEEEPERVLGTRVSAGLLPMLGIRPVVGRTFTEADDRPGANRVCILGNELWERRYASSQGALGSTLMIDDQPCEIIGVLAAGVGFPHHSEIWTPLAVDLDEAGRDRHWLDVMGRLAPGVELGDAQAELTAIAARLESVYPESNGGWSVKLRELKDAWLPSSAQMGVVAQQLSVSLILLIVLANIANLVMAESQSREREMAVRLALGAGRRRLLRLFVFQSLMLAVLGGVVGTVLGSYGTSWLRSLVVIPIPYWIRFDPDAATYVYAAAVTLGLGVLSGLAPAIRFGARGMPVTGTGSARSGVDRRSRRVSSMLVIAQLSTSLVLVVGSLLVIRSLQRLSEMPRGHEVEHVLTLRMSLGGERFTDLSERVSFAVDVAEAVAGVPGVLAAGVTNYLPASTDGWSIVTARTPGIEIREDEGTEVAYYTITHRYFEALKIPLESGRAFSADEVREGADVAIVSRATAEHLWPAQDPIGREMAFGTGAGDVPRVVVGVVGDVEPPYQLGGVDEAPGLQVYVPFGSEPGSTVTLAVLTSGAPEQFASAVRGQIRARDSGVPVYHVATMERVLTEVHWVPRLFSQQFSVFGVVALLIAMIGVYAVTADAVGRRTREFGVRMAVGAHPRRLVAEIARGGARFGAWGVVIGLGMAAPMALFLGKIFRGVEPWDPVVFGGVILLLLGTATVATGLAGRRAARVDPVITLSAE